jgi:hypothetical protein
MKERNTKLRLATAAVATIVTGVTWDLYLREQELRRQTIEKQQDFVREYGMKAVLRVAPGGLIRIPPPRWPGPGEYIPSGACLFLWASAIRSAKRNDIDAESAKYQGEVLLGEVLVPIQPPACAKAEIDDSVTTKSV